MTTFKRLALLACLAAASACGGSDNPSAATTTPTVIVGPTSTLFEGTVGPGGFAFYSFTTQQTANASLMLASVTSSTAPGTSSSPSLGIAIGVPSGIDCTIEKGSIAAAPALTSQLVVNLTPGLYCARVYDIGNLKSTVNFAVRITHT
jgi:hypothetical protein